MSWEGTPSMVDWGDTGAAEVELAPVATAAAVDAVANGNGKAAVQTLVEIPGGPQRRLSPGDVPPEPFLYRNLEEVANKLGAAPFNARSLAWKRDSLLFYSSCRCCCEGLQERAQKRRAGCAQFEALKSMLSNSERFPATFASCDHFLEAAALSWARQAWSSHRCTLQQRWQPCIE